MSPGAEINRLARALGIVVIFTLAGPLAASAVFGLLVLFIGVPLLQTLLEVVDLGGLSNWLSIAVFLLAFFAIAAVVMPAAIAGLAFAIASVYCGLNSLWVALAIMGIVVIGVVALGSVLSPAESSPLLLPSVKGLRQGAFLALFLAVPGAVAAGLCWLFSRPLHRSP